MLLFMKHGHYLLALHFRRRVMQKLSLSLSYYLSQLKMSSIQEVMKSTLVLEQVQLSEPKVSILGNHIEDVTDNMPIALRKEKQLCVEYPISQFVCTDHLSVQHQSFIIVIDAIKTPISI
ncbi:hypothetical protein CR513_04151, partial [Mucuna pruriens]